MKKNINLLFLALKEIKELEKNILIISIFSAIFESLSPFIDLFFIIKFINVGKTEYFNLILYLFAFIAFRLIHFLNNP